MDKYYDMIKKYEARTSLYMALGIFVFSIVIIVASHAHTFVLVFSALLDSIAVLSLIPYFLKSYKQKIKRTLRRYGLNEETVAYDLDRNEKKYDKFEKIAALGNMYALFINPDPELIVYDKTIWIYLYDIVERTTGIGIRKYYIVCVDESGKKYSALIPDEDIAKEIYLEIKKLAPWCYFGLNSSFQHMLENDLQTMKMIVQHKKSNIY